jgi:hypothetical protein
MWLVTFVSMGVSIWGVILAGKGQSMPSENEEKNGTVFLGMLMFIGGIVVFLMSGYYLMSG